MNIGIVCKLSDQFRPGGVLRMNVKIDDYGCLSVAIVIEGVRHVEGVLHILNAVNGETSVGWMIVIQVAIGKCCFALARSGMDDDNRLVQKRLGNFGKFCLTAKVETGQDVF